MTQWGPQRYFLISAMPPEDVERHLERIHRELRNAATVYPEPAAFNVSIMSFNCFIPILEFDQKMDTLMADIPKVGQNILLHEIVKI